MTTPKPILQVVADTPIGQQTADSLIQELRAKGYTVSGSTGDVLIAVIAPGTNPLQLVQAARTAGTPILVVAVGALPPHFAGSEYSAVEPVRHDGAIPGRTRELVEDALDEIAALKKAPSKPINPDETPIPNAQPIVPPPTNPKPADIQTEFSTTSKIGCSPRAVITAVGAVLALMLAFLALFPEETRTDWFRSLGLIAASTQTPTPTATATQPPPTETHTPTDTPTDPPTLEPSATDAPTRTAPPDSFSMTATAYFYSVQTAEAVTPDPNSPATNDIEDLAITATAAPTITGGVEIQLFIADDTLAIYSAESSEIIPQLRMSDASGETHALSDYSALNGIPFDFVNPPLCVVLRLSNADSPFPQVCQNLPNPNNLFRHPLTQADVFWYDSVQGARGLSLLLDDTPIGFCPAGQAECTIEVPGQ